MYNYNENRTPFIDYFLNNFLMMILMLGNQKNDDFSNDTNVA